MNNNLQIGDMGDNVKIIQGKLKQLGLYNAIITGRYGLATKIGVEAFQRNNDIPVTGIVNSITYQRLVDYTEPLVAPISIYPTLSLGSTGSYVTDLQTKLKTLLYYTGDINGNFDLDTENAVKRLQVNNELTADGKVGSQTWNKINSLYGNLNDCAIDNNITDNEIYTVVSGDTLYGIAQKYNTTVDAIKILNNLTTNKLQIGQKLKIPNINNDGYIKYTVVSGDTLYGIARKYNTTVDAIKNINNLSSNILQIGQIINIPTSNQGTYINYVVVSGDTLYKIANIYNVSIDTLKSLNNLTNNILRIGQVLKIPTNVEVNYITHTVVSGDTLYGIARQYNTTVNDIKELNNLNSNILSLGQVLKIPV